MSIDALPSIIVEMLAFRANELKAGRDPKRIDLTDDQKVRLKDYCKKLVSITTME